MKRFGKLLHRSKKKDKEKEDSPSSMPTAASNVEASPRVIVNDIPAVSQPAPTPSPAPSPSTISTSGPFIYQPLASPSSFRLLHLKRRLDEYDRVYKDVSLEGELLEVPLSGAPEYFALSYTWGAPTPTSSILLDGRSFGITANCAAALRRMLRGKSERLIWVDSICINQASDAAALEERAGQVARMDQIYKGAVQVLVHLGEGDEKSDVACQAVKDLAAAYSMAIGAQGEANMEEGRRRYEAIADDVLNTKNVPDFPYGKLHGLFRLPWFRRVWVVQEVSMASKVMFYCGEYMMHFVLLAAAADFSRLPYSKQDNASNHWKSYVAHHEMLQKLVKLKSEGQALPPSTSLMSILGPPALTLDATRPEDKVFAFYGICKFLGYQLPAPDYQKPLAVVYTEASRAIIQADSNLELLESVEGLSGAELGLPTWALNFGPSFRSSNAENPPHMAVWGRSNRNLSGNSTSKGNFEFLPDGRGLKIKGRRVGRVCAVGQPWEVDNSTNLLGDAVGNNAQFAAALVECFESWVEVAKGDGGAREGDQLYDFLARVLTADLRTAVRSREAWDQIVRCLKVIHECSRVKDTVRGTRLIDPAEGFAAIVTMGNLTITMGMYSVIMQLQDCVWKVMFRLTTDNMCLGTYNAKLGDHIVVAHGASLAYVLRQCPDGFRFVGSAYVYGIMEGEFWGKGGDGDDEWFTLA